MRLTVCQVLPALEEGGVERGTVEVARALVERGHRALVVSAGGRLVEALRACGAEHLTMPIGAKNLAALRAVGALRALWQRERVDIVHLRSRFPAWLAELAWRSLPAAARPLRVATVHGAYAVNAYSAVMLRADAVIAISEFIRDYLRANYRRADPARIALIPRGVAREAYPYGFRPAPDWCARWTAQYPRLAGQRLLALPARLTRRKGHVDFLALIAGLRAQGRAVHGLIVGGEHPGRAAYAAELRASIARAGLAEHVTLTGHRADLREILAMSALSCAISEAPEAFGRTALEALSLGVPVIGYDHGGTGEILRAVYPAGLVPAGDRAALLARAAGLLDAPPPVPAEHPYALQSMLARTVELYEALAARRPAERT